MEITPIAARDVTINDLDDDDAIDGIILSKTHLNRLAVIDSEDT